MLTHIHTLEVGTVTMTTNVGTNGATTTYRMNFSRYVGHVTIFSCMLFSSTVRVIGSGFGLDLVSG